MSTLKMDTLFYFLCLAFYVFDAFWVGIDIHRGDYGYAAFIFMMGNWLLFRGKIDD